MTTDVSVPATLSLKKRRLPLASASEQRRVLESLEQGEFDQMLIDAGLAELESVGVDTLQINVGRLCNQACSHCHVDAGPDRTEVMTKETMEFCLAAVDRFEIPSVDITGGAPELNPHFRWLVEQLRARGRHVTDRCNLTVLETRAHRDLPEFFARHDVEVVASLPHYRSACTDKQRGAGVYDKSIRALTRLNALGYGRGQHRLVLVTNPVGAYLPGPQACAEIEWKRELGALHGIAFDALYSITNMPISRYLEWLLAGRRLDEYMETLVNAFNPAAVRGVMCRTTLSVGYDGRLYDCDFNQMLELPMAPGLPTHIAEASDALFKRRISTGRHCFGCTAGSGSGCTGATVS